MRPYIDEAIVLKLGFEAGLYTVADAVQWADSVLAEVDYDEDLANICLGGQTSPKVMYSLLHKLGGDHEEWEPMRRILAIMHDQLLGDRRLARSFARFLEAFWIRHGCEVLEDMGFMAGIDDEFILATEGCYGTLETATDALIKHLEHFKLAEGDRHRNTKLGNLT